MILSPVQHRAGDFRAPASFMSRGSSFLGIMVERATIDWGVFRERFRPAQASGAGGKENVTGTLRSTPEATDRSLRDHIGRPKKAALWWALVSSKCPAPDLAAEQQSHSGRAGGFTDTVLLPGSGRPRGTNSRRPGRCSKDAGARQRELISLAVLRTLDRVVERRVLSPQVSRLIMELWGKALCLALPG